MGLRPAWMHTRLRGRSLITIFNENATNVMTINLRESFQKRAGYYYCCSYHQCASRVLLLSPPPVGQQASQSVFSLGQQASQSVFSLGQQASQSILRRCKSYSLTASERFKLVYIKNLSRMRRLVLVWIHAGRKPTVLVFSWRRSFLYAGFLVARLIS